MVMISTAQSTEFKEIVLNYLHGESISRITGRLKDECIEFNLGCKALYKSIPVDPSDPLIIAIVLSLNIQQHHQQNKSETYDELMKSENLYELLMLLSNDGHRQISYLLNLISNTKPKRNWTRLLILGTIGSAGAGAFFYVNKPYFDAINEWFLRTFPFVINWARKTFSVLRNIPLLMIVYSILDMLWNWHHIFSNDTTTNKEKLNRLFFKTLTISLTISAYILSFYAAGAVTIPVALLFVLSSSIDLFQGVFDWFNSKQSMKEHPGPNINTSPFEIISEYKRTLNLYQFTISSVYIKLAAAVLTTIAVGIWNFFPPTLSITIFCACFVSLTDLTARSMLSNLEEASANQLQKTLELIKHRPGIKLRPSNQKQYYDLEERELELHNRETALFQREADFEELILKRQREFQDYCNNATHAFQGMSRTRSVAPEREAANEASDFGSFAAERSHTGTSKSEPLLKNPGNMGLFAAGRRHTAPLQPTGSSKLEPVLESTSDAPLEKQFSMDL